MGDNEWQLPFPPTISILPPIEAVLFNIVDTTFTGICLLLITAREILFSTHWHESVEVRWGSD